jgi:hypothetical protein
MMDKFSLSALIYHRKKKWKWLFFLVYDPMDHGRTSSIHRELEDTMGNSNYMFVVGGF